MSSTFLRWFAVVPFALAATLALASGLGSRFCAGEEVVGVFFVLKVSTLSERSIGDDGCLVRAARLGCLPLLALVLCPKQLHENREALCELELPRRWFFHTPKPFGLRRVESV